MKTMMAIDPSINFCGVSIFEIKKRELIDAVLVKPEKIVIRDGEWYDKAFSIFNQVNLLRKKHGLVAIACELPDYWSVAGYMARESGSITKLSFMCGLFYGMRNDVDRFVFALPREWKGQLSKDVVRNRLEPHYVKNEKKYSKEEWKKLDHNILDSIGIGHWSLFGRV